MEKYKKFYPDDHVGDFVMEFKKTRKRKYIMGCNEFSSAIIDVLDVVDDFEKNEYWNGKKIYRTDGIEKDSLVLVSASVRAISAVERLYANGIFNVLDLYAFEKNCSLNYKRPIFFKHNEGFDEELRTSSYFFDFVSRLFYDSLSREIFYKIVNFRKTYDIGWLCGFENNPSLQYFEFDLKGFDVFLDVGGYCGETTIEFIKRYPNYKKVYFFEPNRYNMKLAKENLKNFNNIEYINKGCSYKSGSAYITNELTASTIIQTDSASDYVELVSIDEVVGIDERIFIKMDIEGSEYDALIGALNLIKNGKVAMAVSVYHKSDDLWKIPLLVLSINKNYRLFLRHYTEGINETVMYFLPF